MKLKVAHHVFVLAAIAIATLIAPSALVLAQQDDWYYNSASAPVRIEWDLVSPGLQDVFKRKTWVGLRNVSRHNVFRYEFGCVTRDAGKVRVIEALSWAVVSGEGMQPGYFSPGLFNPTDPSQDENEAKCKCKSGRLAVVTVDYSTGEHWSIADSNWDTATTTRSN